jgi:hypothetical protein
MSNKADISDRDQRLLHTKSGNHCAMCNIILADDSVCIGQNAHIYGENKGAARYDSSLPIEYVNSEKNLIFLCCNCHKKIDSDEGHFPPNSLFALKRKHEQNVMHTLKGASIDYTNVELRAITEYLIRENGKASLKSDYRLLHIPEKITKNQLTEVQGFIDTGLITVARIEDYINRHPDPSFSERLTDVFIKEYVTLKSGGMDSVSIFNALWDYICYGNVDYNNRAAGLALLVYFFEKCEVFEK